MKVNDQTATYQRMICIRVNALGATIWSVLLNHSKKIAPFVLLKRQNPATTIFCHPVSRLSKFQMSALAHFLSAARAQPTTSEAAAGVPVKKQVGRVSAAPLRRERRERRGVGSAEGREIPPRVMTKSLLLLVVIGGSGGGVVTHGDRKARGSERDAVS